VTDRLTGVFSYGSLIIPESASAAVGREVSADELVEAFLPDFRRVWGAYVPITMSELDDEEVDGVFFDVTQAPGHYANGIILPATEAELRELTLREKQYDVFDVSDRIVARCEIDHVVTFVGKPAFRQARGTVRAVIPQRYHDRVLTAARARGDRFHRQLVDTTEPSGLARVGGTYGFVDPEQARRV
jgi:hypothetical protein